MARRSVEQHAALVSALLRTALDGVGTERVVLADALGRVSAEPVVADGPLPPFRNSQMDGYAARAAEIAEPGTVLPVDRVVPAAAGRPIPLPRGRLAKVMTGAPMPEGADCVVPVEDVVPVADVGPADDVGAADGAVRVLRGRAVGEFVREPGSDLAAGATVVEAGVPLTPRQLAAAAAVGAADVLVRRRIRVAVLATGTEVVPPGSPLAFGQVHDANGVGLAALATAAGAQVTLVALADDDAARFASLLDDAAAVADLVLTAGGVSKGDFEVVRQVLEPAGADVAEVAMQPGGPQATATWRGVPVLCFPGNPVSAQVSFTVFLRPLLRQAAGLAPIGAQRARLAHAIDSPPERRQWLRATVSGGVATPVGGPSSHLVATMARADHLIDVPAAATRLPADAPVDVVPL